MGAGTGGIMDILFFASGVYLIYTAVMAKRNGNIAGNAMLGKNVKENDIKDRAGFIAYMYKRMVVAGGMIIIASIIHLVNDYYMHSMAVTGLGILIILAAIGIYTAAYLRGQKQYMRPQEKRDKEAGKRHRN